MKRADAGPDAETLADAEWRLGLPRDRRGRVALLAAIVGAVAADRLWFKGTIFHSAPWRLVLDGMVIAGVAVGALAHGLRRS